MCYNPFSICSSACGARKAGIRADCCENGYEQMAQVIDVGDEGLRIRRNAMAVSSMDMFANIRGGVHGGCKDVYFVRLAGVHSAYTAELERMEQILVSRAQRGQGRYARLTALPNLRETEDISYYSGCYDLWIGSGRRQASIHASQGNAKLEDALGRACCEAAALFQELTPQASASMEKNFIVKLLFWADRAAGELLEGWSDRASLKCAVSNITKKQEYLFCCLLTMLGIDMLLLQYRADIDGQLEQLKLSVKIVLGDYQELVLAPYDPAGSFVQSESRREQPSGNRPPSSRPTIPVSQTWHPDRQRPAGMAVGQSAAAGRSIAAVPGFSAQSAHGAARELDFEELARLASSVVMITIHDGKGEAIGTGSGIMIGRGGYILTNNHVASGGRFYSVRIEDDNNVYKTDEVIKYNPLLDLAVIRIDRDLNPLPIYRGGKPLVRGQKVVAIGSPLGLFNSVSDGIISGFRVIGDVDMIQFTAPTSHGSSGGAVLNMYGEVIGISTAGIENGQNINLAVGYECISNFVRGFT